MVKMGGGHGSLAAGSGDEDDDSAPPQIRALPDGAKKSARKAAARNWQALMNDAQQQTSAVVDGNDSDVDSDDDVPMGPWGLWPQPALGTTVVWARFVRVLWSSCALYSPLG